jgi:hypothetical protein
MTLTHFNSNDREWKNEEREHTELTSFHNQIEHSFWESHYEPGLFHTNISREDYFVLNDERSKTKFVLEFSWRYDSCS